MPGWREADVKVEDELLEKRVADWQLKIQPLLDEQAPSFDIGMYGQRILGVMASEVRIAESKLPDLSFFAPFGPRPPKQNLQQVKSTCIWEMNQKLDIQTSDAALPLSAYRILGERDNEKVKCLQGSPCARLHII